MKPYGICFSLSDLFHLALYTQSPSLLLQMARFHFFNCLFPLEYYNNTDIQYYSILVTGAQHGSYTIHKVILMTI